MAPRQKSIPEADFVIVNFKGKHLSSQLKQWHEENLIGVAMSCARQVWYGVGDDFKTFPFEDNPEIALLKGAKAYAFMLKLLIGMDSDKKGEVNIKGQFYKNWKQYKEVSSTDRVKTLDIVMQHLRADSRSIQTEILSQHKIHEHCLVARDLMGGTKGKTILLVGHVNKRDNMSNFTSRIVRLAVSKNQRAEKILITHPGERVAKTLFRQAVDELQALKINPSILKNIDFYGEFSSRLEEASHVFVDTVMGENEQADSYMIEAWKGREGQDNILAHLKGDTSNMGLSNSLWSDAKLDDFVSPDEIKRQMVARGKLNKEVSQIAEDSYVYCARLRLSGTSPSKHKINQKFSQHSL